jgi:hypothetical protein
MWHIVYLSFEEAPAGRHYIGKHSTAELNDGYLGSYKDTSFHPTSRIILGYYKTSEAAVAAEIQWQRVFQVVKNQEFANRAYQTSVGWDNTGNSMSEEQKQKISDSLSGEKHFFFGKERPDHSEKMKANNPSKRPEVAEKISQSMRGDNHHNKRPEMRQKISQVMTGYRWWTNGSTSTRDLECPGPEWVIGRHKTKQK